MKKFLSTCLILCLASALFAQGHLQRKGSLGVKLAPTPEEISHAGIYIQEVMPHTTAASAGLEDGDLLLSVNEVQTPDFASLGAAVGTLWGGDAVTLKVWRDDQEKLLQGTVVPRPKESSETADILYDEVKFGNGYLRSIINKPKGKGKRPAILFIPGYPCASYDNMPPLHPYRKLIESFVEKGYVVMRVEKPGMGDGTGYDCFEIDIETENKAFEAGYRALLSYDFVDPEATFIFGHSLGGISAPVVAEATQPKGIMVYGTAYEPWMEYLIRMLRFQNPFLGVDWVENEKDLRVYHSLLYEQFVLKKSPQELCENDDFKRILERDFEYDGENGIFGRHYTFWNSVNDLNLTRTWSEVSSHVLSIYGEADFEALDSGNHEAIARLVNHYHPGKAEFLLLPGTNHSMIEVGSMEEGIRLRRSPEMRKYLENNFSQKLIEACDKWMKDLMEGDNG